MNRDNLVKKLAPWIEDPPDFFVVEQAFRNLGAVKAEITLKKRDIERAEEHVILEVDKPRSNEAKQKKLEATAKMKDELADLESQHAILEQTVKRLEYCKTMFNAATFALRVTLDI